MPTSSDTDLLPVDVGAAGAGGFGAKRPAAGAVHKEISMSTIPYESKKDIPVGSFFSEEASLFPNMFDVTTVGAIAHVVGWIKQM